MMASSDVPAAIVLAFFCFVAVAKPQAGESGLTPEEIELQQRCATAEISENDVLKLILANYSKQARPRRNHSEPVEVSISLRIFAIREFHEIESTLRLSGYVNLLWHDDFLQWADNFPYNCMYYLYFDADLVWCPYVSFMSGVLGRDPSMYPSKGVKVSATSDGGMELYPMGEIAVKCQIDLKYFPFDKQICSITMESWVYPNSLLQLVLYKPENISAIFHESNIWVENEEWEFVDNASAVIQPYYDYLRSEQYDRAIFQMVLRRKPLFYKIHLITPGIIIGVVESVTFLLPVQNELRLHISFTCLLAYTVFEEMVFHEIPKNDKIPLLSIFINLQMVYIGVIAIMGEGITFGILRQARSSKLPPPEWMFRLFRAVGRLVFYDCQMYREKKTTPDEPANLPSIYTTYGRQATSNHFVLVELHHLDQQVVVVTPHRKKRKRLVKTNPTKHFTESLNPKSRWIFIAEVIERCNMIIYLFATCITPAIIFWGIADHKQLSHENMAT